MENASKALIIAGGILLAMMILALLIYVSTSMSSVAEEQDKRILTQQIEEFNKGYLAYNKTRMYGTDVLTVYNKAQEDREDYDIVVNVLDTNGNNITIEDNHDFKISIFKCEEVSYNNETGRVNKMIFRKIEKHKE